MDGGRRGAPLRTDRVLHPPASPLICVSDDTQPLSRSLTVRPLPVAPLPTPLRSSCYLIRRARLWLRMRTAGHRPSWRASRCIWLCTVAKVRAARDIRRASNIRPLSGDPGPLEMGNDFDVHGIGMGTRRWPLMRTSVYLANKVSQVEGGREGSRP